MNKFPCDRGHAGVRNRKGECCECNDEDRRAAAEAQAALGENLDVCINGHVNYPRTKSRGCRICSNDRQREKRRAIGPGKRTYPIAGTPYTCKRGHGAIHGERCLPCNRVLSKKQRDADPEKHRNRVRKWQRADPARCAAASRKWQIAHPDQMQVIRQNRYAAQKSATGRITGAEWAAIKRKYRGRCAYCNEKPPLGQSLQQDHIVPLQGKDVRGPNLACNIAPACLRCNVAKRNHVLSGTQHTLFDVLR